MWTPTSIICPGCHKDTGYTSEQFMYYVISHDILCPRCGFVIIRAQNIMWTHINDRKTIPYLVNNIPTTTYR